jgi:hypothetical protein
MTTTFNAAATKTVGVNATNFEFTFTRLERIAFGPGKITTLGAELERMGATRALVATGKTLGASPLLERVTAAMGPHCAGVFAGVGQHVPASSVRALVAEAEPRLQGLKPCLVEDSTTPVFRPSTSTECPRVGDNP